MAPAIGRFLANVRKRRMGGTPGGIIDSSWAATSGAYGGFMAAMRVIGSPLVFRKSKHTQSFRKSQRMGSVGTMARSAPRPGRPVRGSTTGRALMAAMDLLGR